MRVADQWCLEERGVSVGSEEGQEASPRACTGEVAVAQVTRLWPSLPGDG